MANSAADIQKLYIAYFNRPADPLGLAYWEAQDQSMSSIAQNFALQPEYASVNTGLTTAQIINGIYVNLFGHAADAPGLTYWAGQVNNGAVSMGVAALAILNGATGADLTAVNAKTTAAESFTTAVDTTAEIVGYAGTFANATAKAWLSPVVDATTLAAAQATEDATIADITAAVQQNGTTFTLTTGVDTIVGTANNDTFNATLGGVSLTSGPTLNSFDSIDGGAGNNTLNIVDVGNWGGVGFEVLPVDVTIKNIQTINLSTQGAVGELAGLQASFDVSGIAGLTTLNVASQDLEVFGDNIKAAATTNVNVQSTAGVKVAGGDAVTITTKGNITVAGAAGAVTVTDNGSAAHTITVTGGTTVNATAKASDGIFIGTAGALNVAGTGLLNASASPTGNISVNESTTTKGVTSFGDGEGSIYTNGATSVSVTGTSVGTIKDVQSTENLAATAAVGTSTLASVTLDGVNSSVTITSDALTSLAILDNDDVDGFTPTTTVVNAKAHALALTVGANLVTADGVSAAAPTIEKANVVDATATAVSVATSGAVAVDVTLEAAKATALSFSNAADVTLDAASTNLTKVAAIVATGAGALNLGDVSGAAFAALTSVDASAATGGVTAAISGAEVFKGGAGDDVVTLNGALTKTSGGSIALGAGNNSVLAGTGSIGADVIVDGGVGGINTISASLVNAGNSTNIKNFQILDVSGFGDVAGNGALDASLLSTPVTGVAISTASTAGTATLQNLAAAVTVNDTFNGDNSALVLTHAGTATNSLTVHFADATATGTQTLAITSTGDSAVTVNSGGAKGDSNTFSLTETDNHLTSLTVTGSDAFVMGGINTNTAATAASATTTASSLTTIDGSAATGALQITAGASNVVVNVTTTYTGLTIHGGTGGDTITNDATGGVITEGATTSKLVNTLTVTGAGASINDAASAGADVIHLNGFSGAALLGSGTGVAVSVADDTFGAAAAAKLGDITTVTFGSGSATVADVLAYHVTASAVSAATNGDILVLNGTLHGNAVDFGTVVNAAGAFGAVTSVAGAQTFDQAVFLAESVTANTVTWFQLGGNTYMEDSGATAGTADNIVIKIVGTVDLSHAVVAGHVVTFA